MHLCPLPASIGRVCHHPCEKDCRRGREGRADRDLRPQALRRRRPPRRGARLLPLGGAGAAGLSGEDRRGRRRPVGALGGAGAAGHGLRGDAVRGRGRGRRHARGGDPGLPAAAGDLPARGRRRCSRRASRRASAAGSAGIFSSPTWRPRGLPAPTSRSAASAPCGCRTAARPSRGSSTAWTCSSRPSWAPRRRSPGPALVIGGGNVAMDVAKTALRLGASEVRVIFLETRETHARPHLGVRRGARRRRDARARERHRLLRSHATGAWCRRCASACSASSSTRKSASVPCSGKGRNSRCRRRPCSPRSGPPPTTASSPRRRRAPRSGRGRSSGASRRPRGSRSRCSTAGTTCPARPR